MGSLPFIHFFCFILYVYLVIYVLFINFRAPLNRVCAALLGCFALWSFGSIFIHNQITPQRTVIILEDIISPGWISFISFFLWFILLFTEKKRILKSWFFYPAIFLPPVLFTYKQWTNLLVADYVRRYYGWGTIWSTSVWPYLFYLYVVSFLGIGLFLTFKTWKDSPDPIKKKQAKIIFTTTIISFLLGALTNIILPRLHIYAVPDMGDVPSIIWAVGLSYIILKYRFLTITPSTAAENIISTMSDSLILLDVAGNIVRVNQSTLDLLGYQEKELKSRSVEILMAGEYFKNTLFEKVLKGEDIVNHELSFKSKQGEAIPVTFSCSALKGEADTLIGMICISRDIREWRFMAEELKSLEEKFKVLFENAPDAYYLNDLEGNFIDGNRTAEKLVGYKREELIGKNLSKFDLLPDKQILIAAELLARNAQGLPGGPIEFTVNRKDGTQVPVEVSTFPVKIKNKTVVLGIARDISIRKQAEKELNEYKEHLEELVEERTARLKEINRQFQSEINERKLAEETLRKSKEKYQALTENINVGIYRTTVGADGRFIEANPTTITMFGYEEKGDFMGTKISHHYQNPEDWKTFTKKILERGFVKNEELQLKRKDGTPFIGSISAVVVKDDQEETTYFDGIIEDITERKQLEGQLLQAQKMEAVGRLCGGIAHEFNNKLTAIIGYAELSQMKLDPKNPISDYLKKLLKTADHARDLIHQLLAFSRKAMIQPRVINLNKILENLQTLLYRALGEDIILDFVPGKKLGNVITDPGQIEQMIMNLAVNSRDAMPTGGKLKIMTENIEVGPDMVARYPYMKPGFYILLTVSDTGCGMTKEELDHMFEPFYTTKRGSRGTGLGLASVYGIVKQNNGFIIIDSQPVQGTSVKIFLPRADKPAKEIELMPDISAARLPFGEGTIMVVDDEMTVREIAQKILSECGYNILSAQNGEEALELWEKHKGQVDLLLTDVVMPGISGQQLSRKLKAIKPGLKILYMSGYSEDVISYHGTLDKDIPIIQKPFTAMNLTKKIREVLDS